MGSPRAREGEVGSVPEAGRREQRRVDAAPRTVPQVALTLQRAAGNRAVAGILQRAPARDAPAFAPARAERRQAFLDAAVSKAQLTRDDGLRLWELAGGGRGDTVTPLGKAGEQGRTLETAAAHAKARRLPGFRATVRLRNLSGVNEQLGHSGADAFYASAADILDRRLQALDADVSGFRSQGVMTFAIVGRSTRADAGALRGSILQAIRDAEVHVRGVAGTGGLRGVASPRGGDAGTGLAFDETTDLAPLDAASVPDGGGRAPLAPAKPTARTSVGGFESEAELRHQRFLDAAKELRLAPEQAEELWRVTGGGDAESLTGFGAAEDRLPTLERAFALAQSGKRHAFYVEVDVRNLSGLNEGAPAQADELFRKMAQITEAHLRTLNADVVSFRHGGDELSFVIVTPDAGTEAAGAEAALSQALAAAEEEIRAATGHVADVPHPKHPGDRRFSGTGITWAVSSLADPVRRFRSAADAVRAADNEVEAKKAARGQ